MTKNEIKSALTAAAVPFKAKATLPQLIELYNETFPAKALANDGLPAAIEGEAPGAALLDQIIRDVKDERAEDAAFEKFCEDVRQGNPIGDEYVAEANAAAAEHEDDSLETLLRTFDPNTDGSECPHCGIDLSNGLLHVDDTVPNTEVTYRDARDEAFTAGEYTCMGCGGHFGAPVVYEPKVAGLKIEKDREERNGIKRPSVGGKCRAVWDAMDELRDANGTPPTAKQVKEMATERGWNPNNASIEFYQWRKFNGITGRTPKPAE